MKRLELAYLAGLFDGEGCIQIAHDKAAKGKRTEQHTLICKVSMTDEQSVRGFLLFKGSIFVKRVSKHNPKWKDQWVWSISSNQAVAFLEQIKPFLKLKLKEAETAIEFQKFRIGSEYGNRRGRLPITPEELNKREWYRQELRRLKGSRFPERSWYNDERKRTLVA